MSLRLEPIPPEKERSLHSFLERTEPLVFEAIRLLADTKTAEPCAIVVLDPLDGHARMVIDGLIEAGRVERQLPSGSFAVVVGQALSSVRDLVDALTSGRVSRERFDTFASRVSTMMLYPVVIVSGGGLFMASCGAERSVGKA